MRLSAETLSVRSLEILTGATILGLIFGGLLAAEMFLRLEQRSQFGEGQAVVEKSILFTVDEATGLRRANPGVQSGHISINQHGFRGPEISDKPDPNTVRLAFLGHSTTFDAYAGETENWPYLVAQAFQEELPGCKVEFMNGAVPGYGTGHMRAYYHAYIERHDPDITFVLTGDFNGDLDRLAEKQGLKGYEGEESDWLSENSLLISKIRKNAQVLRSMRSAFTETNKLQPDLTTLGQGFSQRLRDTVKDLQQSGTQPVLITMSSRLRADQSQTEQLSAARTGLLYIPYISVPTLVKVHDYYNSIIVDTARETGALLIADHDSIPPTPEFFIDSSHFTAKGSRSMQERVLRELPKNPGYAGLLRDLRQRCSVHDS